ncbi:MAG: helix-turn-helix domain-containing protein [Desulfuromonadaceae bacterium]|nr:helix-turn-helix domain-containing protein [Desulfuromonadaceae bacterium]
MKHSVCENNFLVEMLTIEQFAERMLVSRTTLYDWIKSGHLLPGRHFIKIGNTIRFVWGSDLFQKLLEDSTNSEVTEKSQPTETPTEVQNTLVTASKEKGLHINPDWLN